MANKRDGAMQERFEKLADTVSAHARQFDAIERRFDTVDQRFDAVDQRLDAIDRRLDGLDQRFDDVLRAFKIESENMREYVAKAAEGYGATLERIERRLEEGLRQSQETFALHSHILQDHGGRITALERRNKRQR
jgi:hypothetical protein